MSVLIIGHGPSCMHSLEVPEDYDYVVRMKERAGPPGKMTHYLGPDRIPGIVCWRPDDVRRLFAPVWHEISARKASIGLCAIYAVRHFLGAESVTLVGFDSHHGEGPHRYNRKVGKVPHGWRLEKKVAHELIEVHYGETEYEAVA